VPHLKEGKMIRYCNRCVMPETKPDLLIDEEGVCNACRSYEKRVEVDWEAREKELLRILNRYRSKDGKNYDCIVPASGGKDSHFQIIKMLELGMNPLVVSVITDKLSEIGRTNIDNMKELGVDLIEISVNPIIRRRINKLSLNQLGDSIWPEHCTIFTIPVSVAVKFRIPLIVWGENSQDEYGGPAAASQNNELNRRWLEEFGGLLGMRVSDLLGQEGIEHRHLVQYFYPTDEELKDVGVTGLFLGYYMPWDGYRNALVAQAYGFHSYHKANEGALVNYENLDNCHSGIHDYFKFLKYGFGRATDQACLHIRRGRLTRAEGVYLVEKLDGKFPWTHLGCPLDTLLDEMDLSLDEFIKVCDRFTNKKLFVCDSKGNLVKDNKGNLRKINYDNVK
jgi:N-acetyl sugar amidotransferase|tara:strand:- start:841 stop:2019 length:1179 start_codon:yes stop_codon:yes gene_type:complete